VPKKLGVQNLDILDFTYTLSQKTSRTFSILT